MHTGLQQSRGFITPHSLRVLVVPIDNLLRACPSAHGSNASVHTGHAAVSVQLQALLLAACWHGWRHAVYCSCCEACTCASGRLPRCSSSDRHLRVTQKLCRKRQRPSFRTQQTCPSHALEEAISGSHPVWTHQSLKGPLRSTCRCEWGQSGQFHSMTNNLQSWGLQANAHSPKPHWAPVVRHGSCASNRGRSCMSDSYEMGASAEACMGLMSKHSTSRAPYKPLGLLVWTQQ